MANLIAIVGPSGTGKTTGMFPSDVANIKGLDPKETLFINVSRKPLPVRGAGKMYPIDIHPKDGGNYVETSDLDTIDKILTAVNKDLKQFKNVVVDDAGYLMGFETMSRATEKGFEKWNELGSRMFKILNPARGFRRDLNVIFTFHQEVGDDGQLKIKTSGKLLDKAIYLDGLFTFIFYAESYKDVINKKVEYRFRTKSDGKSSCKSPLGCFEEEYIPNDMGLILDTINEYYNG